MEEEQDTRCFDRCFTVAGAPNLRDLGGYRAADGKVVARGLVYRSDDLSDLTEDDVDVMARLRIRTVVDFRTAHEAESWPDRLPPCGGENINIPIDAGRVFGQFREADLTLRKTMGVMVSVYRDLAEQHQDAWRRLFALLMEKDRLPLLFHCTAGKDRTGFAAALFLSSLGVDRETVKRDYLYSSRCLANRWAAGVDYPAALEPLYTVKPEFLAAAFEIVDHNYGGPEEYLTKNIGVDLRRMKDLFLVEASE